MNLLWVAPAALALAGLAVVAGLARRAAEEAIGLHRDLARFSELRPAVVDVRDEAVRAMTTARALRSRST